MRDDPAESSDLRPQLRLAAVIALVPVLFLLPFQALAVRTEAFPALFLVYAIHITLTSAVMGVSFMEIGARQAERLSLAFVLGLAANLLLYLLLLPYALPTYPSLISNALTCLLIAGAVLFSWSTGRMLVVSALVCVGFALVGVTLSRRGFPAAPFGLTFTWLGIGAVLAVVCARVLNRFRSSLIRRQDELAALSARLMSLQEEQLRQLSRELHDELGQSLTAVSSYLWLLEQKLPAHLPELRARAGEARHLVAKTLREMRELSQLLRPPGLDVYGLAPSLEGHLRAFGERHQIATSFATEGLPDHLPAELETAIYRITQEALTNVARHARARRVRVALSLRGEDVRLEVKDDGVGFPVGDGASRPGIGLIGIRERVRALGGAITLTSASGACLSVRLPLPAGESGA